MTGLVDELRMGLQEKEKQKTLIVIADLLDCRELDLQYAC